MWSEKAAECARLRSAYQDQHAAGFMTLAELGSKLEERVEELEQDRDALLELYAGAVPETLDRLDGVERNSV